MLPVELFDWNRTEVVYPRDRTIAELFVQQASRTPEAIAVVAGDHRLSYRELDERSNRLARHLQRLGVKPETLVGVAMERSEEIVVSLLGILKAGGAYVPLDPSHPKARLSLVIEDSGLPWILTTLQIRGRLPVAEDRLVVLDTEAPSIALHSGQAVDCNSTAENLAYVIYTSGSTGKPKGVMIEHRNVVNFFTGMDRAIGRGPGVWLAVTSISFDISVLELLWTLTRGFQVVIHGDEGTHTIADEIARHGVTHMQMTPSLARVLTMDPRSFTSLSSLKQLLLGGEALPASLVAKLRLVCHGEICNMYGPTETTIWSTTYHVEEPGSAIPIGRPIANTQVYILDEGLNPVPVGEIGELSIGGDGVVRGYWNRPELTAERFLNDPFRPGGRIYRTGDLARYLPDGNVEYLGRSDFQIKIRGFRVELGEIEAILEQQPGVRQAAVVAREDKAEDKRLVAYLTPTGDQRVAPETLRFALASKLPEYMIPSSFVFLEALPLTENLKLDRNSLLRLPPPDQAPSAVLDPPRNDLERIIAGAWQEALGLNSVGLDDNFFDLGAHSLTVAEVQVRLQEALEREIPLVDLFQFSTVRALAVHLGGASAQHSASDRAKRRLAARRP
ncbi:MAG: non-ribosomal peptide synthetase [Bryobacteraceae bacterium]